LFPALDDEDPDEAFDEEEVVISTLPFDEDIWAFVPPAQQEENMMSCNPFEDLDDTLFHDFGNEEVLEEPLDATNLSEKGHIKHFALRIKPCVIKKRWRSMLVKRKKNLDEVKHVGASLSLLPHDIVEVVQPCSPPIHKVQEVTSLSDECEELVEDVHASTPPAHEDKEMVTFPNGLVKEPLHMVDEHIDTFIQTGRRMWDFGRLIFDRDPIYNIEGSPQEEGFELSSSEDYFSCIYDSYVWEPDDDMITDLFGDTQPLSSSILEEYQDVATSERSEAHPSK
jgi:hypothetical protein